MFLSAVFPVFFPFAVFGNGSVDTDINSLLSSIEPFSPLICLFSLVVFVRFFRRFYRCFLVFDYQDKKFSLPDSVLKVLQQHPNSVLKSSDKKIVSLHKN